MIVDDSSTNIKILKAVLKDNYRLSFAASAREALAKLSSETLPDLILLDIIMPDMDGYQLCRSIKSDPLLKEIPIIFITAMTELEDEKVGLELGAIDYISKPFEPSIVRLRVKNQIELKRQRDILSLMAQMDGLTGIPNRRAFDYTMDKEWRRGIRNGKKISLLILDIDMFKSYNDCYGHLAGDDCLKDVASTIERIGGRAGDFIARYGGEEFVGLLPDTDEPGAMLVAQRIKEAIEALSIPHAASSISDILTVSIGISTVKPDLDTTPSSLIKSADSALYSAKSLGRNRIETAPSNKPQDA